MINTRFTNGAHFRRNRFKSAQQCAESANPTIIFSICVGTASNANAYAYALAKQINCASFLFDSTSFTGFSFEFRKNSQKRMSGDLPAAICVVCIFGASCFCACVTNPIETDD